MNTVSPRPLAYRWVVLAVFMLVNLAIQILWISYAPVTGQAAAFYGVSELKIGLFSMAFMIAFIPLSIPVSWMIDTLGFRVAVGFGSILMGSFGIVRGLAGANYGLALVGTIGLAASQPFLLNAWTKVPALWFPKKERATAVGLVTLSNLTGTALGMLITPSLASTMPLPTIQLGFGLFAALCAVLFIGLAREKPAVPPDADGAEERALMLDGLKHAFSVPSFNFCLVISFICLGIFNGVSTWIEPIVRSRGISPQEAGTLGAIMLAAGVVGAVTLPTISDRQGKRKPFIAIAVLGAIPGVVALAFAPNFLLLCAASAVFGFFLTSVLPIGMQYASEITRPTPEGTSNGLIQLFGQASVVFVYGMGAINTSFGSFIPALLVSSALLIMSALLVRFLREIKTAEESQSSGGGPV